MTIRKSNPYLSLVNSYLIDSPQPSSINYWWNVGSLLGLCLVIQIASGIFLAMHYSSNIELAFNSVEHIMRDVNAGWLLRYIHANGASFFFICLYLHIGKALYYGSYKTPRVLVWSIGVIIFILVIATAFMGYTNNSPKSIYKISNPYYYKINNNNNNNKKYIFNQKRFISYYVNTKQDETNPEEIFKELSINVEDYWINLHDNKVRSKMITHLKNKGGIYIIINKLSRNYYIGSASINNIYTKFTNHMLNYHGSKLVKRAILKDGLNNFIFGILEYYPNYKEIDNVNFNIKDINLYRNNLFDLETMYLTSLMPKYNILREANTSIGYKHTDETIEKLKSTFSNERRLLLSKLQSERKGKWSEESKDKLRQIAFNRPKDYLSDKGRLRISTINSLKINIYDLNNNYLCEFKNINTASHYLCCSNKTIKRSLDIGWIYIPNIFSNYLNNNYISNNIDFIDKIAKDNLFYKNTRNKLSRIKSGLYNYDWNNKYYIRR